MESGYNSPYERSKFIEEIYEKFQPGDIVRVIDQGVNTSNKKIVGIPNGTCIFRQKDYHLSSLTGNVLPDCKGWAHRRAPVCVEDESGNTWGLGFFCVLEKVKGNHGYPPISQIGTLKIFNKDFCKRIGLLSSANKIAKVINKPIFGDYLLKSEWAGIDYNNISNVAFEVLDDGGLPLKTPIKVLLPYPTDAVFEPDLNKANFVGDGLGDERKVTLDPSIYKKYRNFLEKEMAASLGIPSAPSNTNPIIINKSKIKVEVVKIKR